MKLNFTLFALAICVFNRLYPTLLEDLERCQKALDETGMEEAGKAWGPTYQVGGKVVKALKDIYKDLARRSESSEKMHLDLVKRVESLEKQLAACIKKETKAGA